REQRPPRARHPDVALDGAEEGQDAAGGGRVGRVAELGGGGVEDRARLAHAAERVEGAGALVGGLGGERGGALRGVGRQRQDRVVAGGEVGELARGGDRAGSVRVRQLRGERAQLAQPPVEARHAQVERLRRLLVLDEGRRADL